MPQNFPTLLVAIYGAVVSTIVAIFQIWKHFQDAGKLKVSAAISVLIPDHQNKRYLSISVTNVGRRPITITNIGGHLLKYEDDFKGFIFKNHYIPLPKKLEESETAQLLLDPITPDLLATIRNFKFVGVYDSHNRCHKIKKANLRNLKKNLSQSQ